MFVDGLWASGMTLHIHRNGAPIPKEMQSDYIKIELSAVQMNAIAAVLGLGYRDGELLYYKDDDVDANIMRDDGFGIRNEYYLINSDSRRARNSIRVSKSFASSDAGQNVSVVKDSTGTYDFLMPANKPISFNDTEALDIEEDDCVSDPGPLTDIDCIKSALYDRPEDESCINMPCDYDNDDGVDYEDAGDPLPLDSETLKLLFPD